MGMWDLTPFGNDTAADLAGNLRDLPGPAERVQVIAEVLAGVLNEDIEPSYLSVHSMGWRLEEGVAAAAIVADAHRGEMLFTKTSTHVTSPTMTSRATRLTSARPKHLWSSRLPRSSLRRSPTWKSTGPKTCGSRTWPLWARRWRAKGR